MDKNFEDLVKQENRIMREAVFFLNIPLTSLCLLLVFFLGSCAPNARVETNRAVSALPTTRLVDASHAMPAIPVATPTLEGDEVIPNYVAGIVSSLQPAVLSLRLPIEGMSSCAC